MDGMMVKKEKRIVEILVWGLIGLVLSMSIAAMIISGSHSIKSFYDVGKVYEIRTWVYKSVVDQDYGYQDSNGKVTLNRGKFNYGIIIDGNNKKWNYYCIDLEEVDSECLECTINYGNLSKGVLEKGEKIVYELKEGMNSLETTRESFNVMEIEIAGDDGDSFKVNKMQIRDTIPAFTMKDFVKWSLMTFLIYLVVLVLALKIFKKIPINFEMYKLIELLQDIYILIANQLIKINKFILSFKLSPNMIRTLLFLVMFLYNVWLDMQNIYIEKFKYHVLVYIILLLIISIVSIEEHIRRRNWNNPLVWSWLVFWVMVCISDFVVEKSYQFAGYAVIFGVGFFIFIWNNMENPEEMLVDFKNAIHVLVFVFTIFCIICRPELEGIRYSGFNKNPSVFALYLAMIWAVLLCEMEEKVKIKSSLLKLLPYIIEICIVFVFAWKAQAACPVLCMGGIGAIWFLRNLYFAKRESYKKYFVSIVLICIVALIPVYAGIDWGINHIPQKLNTSITIKGEQPIAKEEYGMVVRASGISEKVKSSRLGEKFSSGTLSSMLSGRDYYYRTYLRKMNLLGHEDKPVMWGKRRLPHNAVLGVAYNYGVFASVPYLLMLIFTIVRTLQYSEQKKKYVSMSFFVCFSVIIMSMLDNIEQPFNWLPWFGLHLLMGSVFIEKDSNL